MKNSSKLKYLNELLVVTRIIRTLEADMKEARK